MDGRMDRSSLAALDSALISRAQLNAYARIWEALVCLILYLVHGLSILCLLNSQCPKEWAHTCRRL